MNTNDFPGLDHHLGVASLDQDPRVIFERDLCRVLENEPLAEAHLGAVVGWKSPGHWMAEIIVSDDDRSPNEDFDDV